MNYDFSISENVSLSRILDQLINDNEKPEVIINFLKMYDNDFKDIIDKSICWKRIFQLDFIFECNDTCIDYIVSKLTDIDYFSAMYLVWQILKVETNLPKLLKDKVRTFAYVHLKVDNSASESVCSSPYAYSAGRYVEKTYDLAFFDACNKKCLVDAMCSMTDNDLKNYCDYIEGSLFSSRFLQYDVFSCLSDIQKFIVLRSMYDIHDMRNIRHFTFTNFITQILESDERPEVKYEAIKYFDQFDIEMPDENDYVNCSSFSELLIRMSIDGAYDYHSIIQRLLRHDRLGILKEWIEYDEAGFNEAYNISGLVRYMLKLKGKKAA